MIRSEPYFVGEAVCRHPSKDVRGECVELDGEPFFRIAEYDAMRPFLMSLTSDSDHWVFISSTGGLTAGRKDPDHALFPYTTDDRLHDAGSTTGGKTLLFATFADRTSLWTPFSDEYAGLYSVRRNLYKNLPGNVLVFEEINADLGLTLRCSWQPSPSYGLVRECSLLNAGDADCDVRILDGVRNLMPPGVDTDFQDHKSTLLDAYKRNERVPSTNLGVYSLGSVPTDRAVPNEALEATTVWQAGLSAPRILLSEEQVASFRLGSDISEETVVVGVRGAYLAHGVETVPPGEKHCWMTVAECHQDTAAVKDLNALLEAETPRQLRQRVREDCRESTAELRRIIAATDGAQCSRDELACRRHASNGLFNVMRGGLFEDGYLLDRADVARLLRAGNLPLYMGVRASLESLPQPLPRRTLLHWAERSGNCELRKLCLEYLPLTFSRRHGDPSRPWNRFTIHARHADGRRIRQYQGNWRDIFQNWEALAASYPDYVESMVCKFVNATTPDGYNPFRVTRDGFEWEVLDPSDPWSNIGYWGDHQIVYLTRLLDLSKRLHPGRLQAMMQWDIFAYANVPYRIKSYPDLVATPRDTIEYDVPRAEAIEERVARLGGDGRFVPNAHGDIHFVNLAEKLIVPLLAKFANFVAEGGVWMNTQRPEWNDANNALVGAGLSMVTMYALRSHLEFCRDLYAECEGTPALSEEVADLLDGMSGILEHHADTFDAPCTAEKRKALLEALGTCHDEFRSSFYEKGLSGNRRGVDAQRLVSFCERALRAVDASIRANRRADGLVHSYNLLEWTQDGTGIQVRPLQEMLEGQMAALNSGAYTVEECADLLDALRDSDLYRPDQQSFLLYPERTPPGFLEKNSFAAENAADIGLVQTLLRAGDRSLVVPGQRGDLHFACDLRNAEALDARLEELARAKHPEALGPDADRIRELYETVFRHRSFTGRSGSMYKYEGFGCIYWHMVSKLALAVLDITHQAVDERAADDTVARLKQHYHFLVEGIGVHKNPAEYGAFPTDPYSHTPGFAGVQQPGMTGQVKEDIIRRLGELGVELADGTLAIRPRLLREDEFLSEARQWTVHDVFGEQHSLDMRAGSLGFTLCQVPILLHRAEETAISITYADGHTRRVEGAVLPVEESQALFQRSGEIVRVDVEIGA